MKTVASLLVFVAVLVGWAYSESQPTSRVSSWSQDKKSQSKQIAVRVSVWVDPDSAPLPREAEIWFKGYGSLWIARDPVKILGTRPAGHTEPLYIYPDGRNGKEIAVPTTVTSEMCPQGCARDTTMINISDDLIEVVGTAIEDRKMTFSRRD